MIGWMECLRQRDRLFAKRKTRLQEKMQKAHVENQEEEVKTIGTWNGKFRKVQSLKGGKVG